MNYLPYQDFLFNCEARGLSPKTIKSYRNITLLFLKFCEEELKVGAIEEICKNDIQLFLRFKLSNGAKDKYVNGILRVIRAFFVFLMDENYIALNPAEKVKFIKEEKKVFNVYTDKEAAILYNTFKMSDYLSARNKLIISIQLDTGIRCTETILIRESDLFEDRILIHGKGNKQRLVPMSPILYKLIRQYQKVKRNFFFDKSVPNNLFLSRTGRALTVEAIERIYKKVEEISGYTFNCRNSPHTSRHYYAITTLMSKSRDLNYVSTVLGHSSVAITQIYLKSLTMEKYIEKGIKTSPLDIITRN